MSDINVSGILFWLKIVVLGSAINTVQGFIYISTLEFFLYIIEKLVSAWSFSKYLLVLLQEGIFFSAILIIVNRLERSWWPRVALCLYSCSSSEWDQFLHVGVFTYFHISCRIYVFVKMYDVFNLQTLEALYLSVQYLLVFYILALF